VGIIDSDLPMLSDVTQVSFHVRERDVWKYKNSTACKAEDIKNQEKLIIEPVTAMGTN
jgi:hypothetical protein